MHKPTVRKSIFFDGFKTALDEADSGLVRSLFQNHNRILDPFDAGNQRKIVSNFAAFTQLKVMDAPLAAQIATLLPKVPRDLQAVLFTLPEFLPQLAVNGQAEAVANMIGSGPLTREQRISVLETPAVLDAFRKNGQTAALATIRLDLGKISVSRQRRPLRPASQKLCNLSAAASLFAE